MKIQNDGLLHHEARALRMWGTLIASGIEAGPAALAVSRSGTLFTIEMGVIGTRLSEGVSLTDALKDQETFSDFIPVILAEGDAEATLEERLFIASGIMRRASLVTHVTGSSEKGSEVLFFGILGSLSALGIPLSQSLRLAGDQYLSPAETEAIIQKTVTEGEMLTMGMECVPNKFDDVALSYVDIAEQCGTLPEICLALIELKSQMAVAGAAPARKATRSDYVAFADVAQFKFLTLCIEAGASILRAVKTVAQKAGGDDKLDFASLLEHIESGELTLSEGLEKAEFPAFIVSLIRQSEQHGDPEGMLKCIADYLTWDFFGVEPEKKPKLEKV